MCVMEEFIYNVMRVEGAVVGGGCWVCVGVDKCIGVDVVRGMVYREGGMGLGMGSGGEGIGVCGLWWEG